MKRAEREAVRFVRAVLAGEGRRAGDMFVAGEARLTAASVRQLVADGVLACRGPVCAATGEARGWLRRRLLEADAFAGQHRDEVTASDGLRINLAESPLARLAAAVDGAAPFLARHQVEAGERVRRLCERARLQPRVTMSYSAAHTAGGPSHAGEIGDMAADARRTLADLHRALPADCAGVVIDVCGLLKGLQAVESERGWPRRSAKLVLRIGLEQAAQFFGLGEVATGAVGRARMWGERPSVVG